MSAEVPEQQYPGWVPEQQVQQLIDAALARYASQQPSAPAASFDQETIDAQIKSAIDAALAQQQEVHAKAMEALAASMRGAVATFTPEHAGGPGTEIAETWSQYEQEQSRAAHEAKLRAA